MLHNSKKKIPNGDKSQPSDNMLRALLRLVTMQTVAHDDEQRKDIWRHSKQLGRVALEAKRRDNGRREVSKCVEGVRHEEVRDGEEPEERVRDGLLGDFAVPVLVVHGGGVRAQTLDGEGAFFGGEP
jgi:hypothetical protein